MFLAVPGIIGAGGVHQFGQNVTLQCGVFGEGSYNFTWEAPPGSTSLERGIITNATSFSRLTFEAREEDTGIFTCMIDGGTGSTAMAFVIVGNASLFHPVHCQDQCSISLIQFQLL